VGFCCGTSSEPVKTSYEAT